MPIDALDKLSVKQRLLFAAFQLFLQRGVDGTGLEEILNVSGVSRGGLYHHFGSKDGLYDAVLDHYFLREFSEFDQSVFGDLSFDTQKTVLIDMLSSMFAQIGAQYDVDKARYFALFFDSLGRSPKFQRAIQSHYEALISALSEKAPTTSEAQSFLRQLEGEIYLSTIFDRSPDFTSLDPRED
ncbi:TetR/AcrR family transcriptional regulator [Maritalea sp.]|uniref:TetR/AcrR family transcriptional regulator n=1 Tax=Maritalea sp. TaxID=2003361 RepID=UPI003EF0A740